MNADVLSTLAWVNSLPDGAVSVRTQGGALKLTASEHLQRRFEELLDQRKSGQLSEDDAAEYDAICHLDDQLSWWNRLSRDRD